MLQTPRYIVVKTGEKPHIMGPVLREVYIKFQEKNVKKFAKLRQNYKRLDFLRKFVIMGTTREIWMYLIVTI